MRRRRGNYTLLFLLVFAILLAMAAFSIDIARLRVARIQVENAAEAGALAALVQFRDGRGTDEAINAAVAAADQVWIQRVGSGGTSTGPDFSLEFTQGRWDWSMTDSDGDGLQDGVGMWMDDRRSQQAVEIIAQPLEGIVTLFTPAFQFLPGAGGSLPSRWNVTVRSRAAMRARDIVLVVDTSRENLGYTNTDLVAEQRRQSLQTAVIDYVDTLETQGIIGDRVAIVPFAGEAVPTLDLTPVDTQADAIRSALGQDVQPCTIDETQWYEVYRHYDPIYDLELGCDPQCARRPTMIYQAVVWTPLPVDPWGYTAPPPRWGFPPWGDEALWFASVYAASPYAQDRRPAFWDQTLDLTTMCQGFEASSQFFRFLDPRQADFDQGPLECWEGNPLRDAPVGRFSTSAAFDQQTIDCGGPVLRGGGPGVPDPPRFGAGPAPMPIDWSFATAGRNPASGLREARLLLEAQDGLPGAGDPVVVLVTNGLPDCGPFVDAAWRLGRDCVTDWEIDYAAELTALQDLGVDTHVVAIVPTGSAEDFTLSFSTTNLGQYFQSEQNNAWGPLLQDVARQVRLQVVE